MSTVGDEIVAQMILTMYNEFQTVKTDLQIVKATLEGMTVIMADQLSSLTELQTRVNDFRADLFARLDQLETAQGQFTPEAQAIFDDIKNTVAAVDTRVGDADGSDTPPTP